MSTHVEMIGGPLDGQQGARPDCRPMVWERLTYIGDCVVHVYHSSAPGEPYLYQGTRAWKANVDYIDSNGQPVGGFTS